MDTLYYERAIKNGEPFRKGDTVHILVGSYRDRTARVVSACDVYPYAGGHFVTVDLGERVEVGQNVFESTEIMRISADPSDPGDEAEPNPIGLEHHEADA